MDIERKVRLTGGHIFQGEILPQYMWENRLGYQMLMDSVDLCGVVAINGRNAAMEIFEA